MITILDYARIAGHIYHPTRKKFYANFTVKFTNVHSFPTDNGWYCMTDVDPLMLPSNHFFAQLYLQFENGNATDAVIAVRGTLPTDITNDAVDILSWYADVFGEGANDNTPLIFFTQLIGFAIKAHTYIKQRFPHIPLLKLTGHSLGGTLAQLLLLKAGFPGYAVAFNSPGVGNMPGVMRDKQGWIYNINSRYGLVNKIGLTLGHIYLVDVPEMEAEAKLLFTQMDERDFQKSVHYYQMADQQANKKIMLAMMPEAVFTGAAIMADNDVALGYRLDSYVRTIKDAVQQPPLATVIQANCQTADTPSWYHLKVHLVQRLCTMNTIKHELIKIIKAQHSIDNMVQALQMQANAKLAYLSV